LLPAVAGDSHPSASSVAVRVLDTSIDRRGRPVAVMGRCMGVIRVSQPVFDAGEPVDARRDGL